MAWYSFDGADWQECRDPWVFDAGTWKQMDEAYVFDAGTWKRFYQREVSANVSVATSGGTYAGDSVTISGAVIDPEGNAAQPSDGTVLLERGYDDGNWTTVGTLPLTEQGQYTVQQVDPLPGDHYYRATFQPSAETYFTAGQQMSAVKSLGLRSPSLTKGSVTTTSYSCSCSSVAGAITYEFQENSSTVQNTASTSLSRTGRSNNTQYTVRVRAYASTPNGDVSSSWSGTITARTGRSEQRDSGTSSYIYVTSQGRGQYRRDVGWGYVGSDVRQGYYSSSYGGTGYFGVIDYGSKVRDALNSAIGSTRRSKGTCNFAEVYLVKESGVGTGGTVQIGFYTSDRGVGGSEPNLEGSKYTTTSASGGAGAYEPIGTAHGQRLGDYGSRSLVTYQTSSPTGNYASFNGGDTGKLKIRWTWNYVTVTAVSSIWL